MSPTPAALDASHRADLRQHLRSLYGESCRLYRAPGRINLIGEHTDYDGGFVMPAAIQFDCCNTGHVCCAITCNLSEVHYRTRIT